MVKKYGTQKNKVSAEAVSDIMEYIIGIAGKSDAVSFLPEAMLPVIYIVVFYGIHNTYKL